MYKTNLLSKMLLLIAGGLAGVTGAWGDTYKLTITPSAFNGTSYAANNNEKTSQAVSTTNSSKTFEVKWTSNQIMLQSELMQWQKNNSYLYNSTDLGTIISVNITCNDSYSQYFTTYYGTSSNPSSNTTVGGGFFKIKNGNETSKASKIEVTFYKPDEISYILTGESNNVAYGTVSVSGNEITATPAEGCRISKSTPYTVTSGTATVEKNGNVFSVTADADCTIQINFEEIPSHAATFYSNGTVYDTVNTLEDEEVVFPTTNPSSIGNKIFVGWAESEIDGTQQEAPTFIFSYTMETEPVNYYAVFATFTQGNYSSSTDQLTLNTTGVSGNTYTSWTGKEGTSGAIYAGQSAGDYSSIQLRSNNSNSGIISTTSGGNLAKVVVVWNTNTANGRTLDVYGSNTAYSSPSDLYNTSNQGTKLGSIVYGTSTELTITGNYAFIGLRSNSGAMYLTSISITWESGTPDTYTDYCTTLAKTITIGSTGYATYSSDYALNFANSGVTAYTAKYENGKAKLTAVETVPAGAGVVLKATQDSYDIKLISSANTLSNNDLKVSDGTINGGDNIYSLANGDNGVGFYRVSSSITVPEGKCYLEVPTTESDARQFIGFNDEATSIEALATSEQFSDKCFDLQGRRVAQPIKGLYIVNGKKVIIK